MMHVQANSCDNDASECWHQNASPQAYCVTCCVICDIHTYFCMTSKVCLAICCAVGLGWLHATPGMIICSLRRQASRHTPFCLKALTQLVITCSDAAANLSMEWSPSINSSGSTIGTRLHACITHQALRTGTIQHRKHAVMMTKYSKQMCQANPTIKTASHFNACH